MFKPRLFLLLVLLICLCVNEEDPIQSDSAIFSSAARSPASVVTCQNLFSRDMNEILSRPQILRNLDDYFVKLQKQYGYSDLIPEDQLTQSSVEKLLSISRPANLYEEYQAGAETSEVYLALGYTVDSVKDENYVGSQRDKKSIHILKAPSHLKTIYRNAYDLLLSNLDKGLQLDDLVLPALVFYKIQTVNGRDKTSFFLSRPGIDEIPSAKDGWHLGISDEMDSLEYYKNISQGKIPFEVAMFGHDVGHIIDYILHPSLMKLHRRYFKLEYEALSRPGVTKSHPLATHYLNEFMSFPKLTEFRRWQTLIESRAEQSWIAKDENRISQLSQQLNDGTLLKRVSRFEKFFFKGVERHGGASNDGRSLYAMTRDTQGINELIPWYLEEKSHPRDIHTMTQRELVSHDTIYGMIAQMLYIRDVLRKDVRRTQIWEPFFEDGYSRLIKNISAQDSDLLKKYFIELVERFERKTYWALSYQMTGAKLLTDLLSPNFNLTESYQYFLKVAEPGSLEYDFFVDGNYISRPQHSI